MEHMTKDQPNRSGHPWPITLDQCAERLHIKRGTLQKLLKEHPFYRRAGRRILFTREDFKKLLDALPSGESENRFVGWRQSARRYSNARSGSELDEVLKMLEGPERRRSPKKAKVVPLRTKKPRS